MKHLSQESLIDHFYGEDEHSEDARRHLRDCRLCRRKYDELEAVLTMADAYQPPPRGQGYGARVYQQLSKRLPVASAGQAGERSESVEVQGRRPAQGHQPRGWLRRIADWRPQRLFWVPAMAALLLVAFLTGRYWEAQSSLEARQQAMAAKRGVLLLEVGRHLQQAGYLLAEVGNVAPRDGTPMEFEQRKASEMASDGWLFSEAAKEAGDPALAEALEQLQRFLLDIANGPAAWTGQEIEALQKRLEEAGLPMRIRVLEDRVRQQQIETARSRSRRNL